MFRAKVQVVGCEVARGSSLHGGFFARGKPDLELVGDRLSDVALDGEHIGQIAVVLFRPELCAGLRVDEPGAHAHLAADPLDTAFEQVRYAEGSGDLAQVAWCVAAVLRHAGATDDLQVRDLGQIGENFILHAGREVRIVLALGAIVEGEHRDGFVRGGW